MVKRNGRVQLIVGLSVLCLMILAAVPISAAWSSTTTTSTHFLNHEATGVGSCNLIGWNPNTVEPEDIFNAPMGQRPMTYKPDNYDCVGAKFAGPGVEFAKFPQPHNFKIDNRVTTRSVLVCSKSGACKQHSTTYWTPRKAV